LPPVLAHSGLATTDAAATAFTALGILAFVRWVERQTIGRSVTLGATWALAAVSKFSALAFLPAAAAAIVIVRIAMTRRDVVAWRPRLSSKLVTQIGVAAATASIAIWATYLFKVDFPPALGGSVPVPALAFFRGIQSVLAHNTRGHHAYLLGRTSVTGWWYFFPVAVAVKTPLPFLALSIAGLLMLTLSATRLHDWRRSVVPVSAVTILAVVMSSNINIGVRHVLPIYVPLAVAAGCAVMTLWNSARARWVTRSTAVALVLWLEVSSVRAHPDYLAYFNELGGAHPEHVLIDSDLDWGQDFKRLVDTVRSHEIDSIGVVYWGSVDVEKEGTPGMRRLKPNERVTGWVAISELFLNGIYGSGYEWLQAYTPVLRVGKSVWLYHIPPTTDRP
jgi:hypothetical protein